MIQIINFKIVIIKKNTVRKIIEFLTQIDKTQNFAVKIKKIKTSVAITYKILRSETKCSLIQEKINE